MWNPFIYHLITKWALEKKCNANTSIQKEREESVERVWWANDRRNKTSNNIQIRNQKTIDKKYIYLAILSSSDYLHCSVVGGARLKFFFSEWNWKVYRWNNTYTSHSPEFVIVTPVSNIQITFFRKKRHIKTVYWPWFHLICITLRLCIVLNIE